jgi:hypothetical protein
MNYFMPADFDKYTIHATVGTSFYNTVIFKHDWRSHS